MKKGLWIGLIFVIAITVAMLTLLLLLRARQGELRLQGEDEFTRSMQTGKNYLDRSEAVKAAEAFQKAVALKPENPDVHVNLANAFLLRNVPAEAIREAEVAVKMDHNIAAAHYIIGCGQLRLAKYERAVQAFQVAINLDPNVAAVYYQLGRAHLEAGQLEDAISSFQSALEMQADHPVAHFALSQAYMRNGQKDEASKEMEAHQQVKAKSPGQAMSIEMAERCKHTVARLPFKMEQPAPVGIAVVFADATAAAFAKAPQAHGPAGVIDFNRDGRNNLFVGEANGFRLLVNSNGIFQPIGRLLPGVADAQYRRCLVGDLQNDHVEDIVVLGEKKSHVFKFTTNGVVTDVTGLCGLSALRARDGILADLDFTGALDLVVASPSNGSITVFRNLKNFYFKESTATSGIPATVTGVRQLAMEEWNNDELNDLFLGREGQPPLMLPKLRGGAFGPPTTPADWPKGGVIAMGDLNNDLRSDLAIVTGNQIEIILNGLSKRITIPTGNKAIQALVLVDYDNDGWLDILAAGDGLRLWRNGGDAGFREVTAEVGLNKLDAIKIIAANPADFDADGDTDLLLTMAIGELKLLRNDGGNANHQVKLRLVGNRSNSSALGVHLEVAAGGLRMARTVSTLPIEIGIGKHAQADSITVGWFDLTLSTVDVKPELTPVELPEIYFPKGSCPYLYVWNGSKYDFVTDFLGNAPLGLRIHATRFVEADPVEHVWLGNDGRMKPKDGEYLIQVTEELSEALYLDEAKLVVVDHPSDTVVHPTTKMRPGSPFPPSELMTLRHPYPLQRATRSDGADVTELLGKADTHFVSPVQLRVPQLRGLCEPYSVTLDFGPLPLDRPLVLALTGWIKFGGGMANVAASHCPDLPFPFPSLEVETAEGQWKPVDVMVGVPSGKTKTILTDLSGKLPPGSRRLRLSTSYEIRWDCAALYEKADAALSHVTTFSPTRTDLHWRGYSEFQDLPEEFPLTPDYARLKPTPPWSIVPSGWCTRYGDVKELLATRDDALVIVNAGDELTLGFAANRLPPKPEGLVRDFFIFSVGWDKDTDFHVERGTTVTPLPWRGMDDQLYGRQERPAFATDALMRKYNTRWVGEWAISRRGK